MWIDIVFAHNHQQQQIRRKNKPRNLWTTKWLTYQMKDQLSTIECKKCTEQMECILIENYLFICLLSRWIHMFQQRERERVTE